jgi:hypothetical protein
MADQMTFLRKLIGDPINYVARLICKWRGHRWDLCHEIDQIRSLSGILAGVRVFLVEKSGLIELCQRCGVRK